MDHPGEDVYRLKQFYQSYFADAFLAKKNPATFKWRDNNSNYNVDFFKAHTADFDFKTFKFYTVEITDITAIIELAQRF